jgi:hypothetical protein
MILSLHQLQEPIGESASHTALLKVTLSCFQQQLRHHCSRVELFLRAKIQLRWQDFIKNRQTNHY